MPLTLPAATIDRLLDTWPVARLATAGSDGHPHQVPIVFVRLGERLWSPIDGKPKAGREPTRVRNVRARSEVSLLLDEYTPDWSRLWWIRVDARAGVVENLGTPDVETAVAALRIKYPQYEDVAVLRDPPTLLAFDVRRIRSWRADAVAAPSLDT